jgi:hypothetical protein
LEQFWMGDLNYRVEMEDDILRAWVDEKKWSLILEKDQVCLDASPDRATKLILAVKSRYCRRKVFCRLPRRSYRFCTVSPLPLLPR